MNPQLRIRKPPEADPRYSPSKSLAGAVFFIFSETMFFFGLFYAWYYMAWNSKAWPPVGIAKPTLGLPIFNTVVLFGSFVAMLIADVSISRRNNRRLFLGALTAASTLALLFAGMQVVEFSRLPFSAASHTFGSSFLGVLFFHVARVLGGVVFMCIIWLRGYMGQFSPARHIAVRACTLYWLFITTVWCVVFYVLYITWPG